MYFYSPYFSYPTQNIQLLPYYWSTLSYSTNDQEKINRIEDQNSLSTQSGNQKEEQILNAGQLSNIFKINRIHQIVSPQPLVKKIINSKTLQISSQPKQKGEIDEEGVKYSRKRKSATKLVFETQWKNQNRNIIPNIMNQMISYVEKSHKSQKLIQKLFETNPHSQDWTIKKFYFYMKLMRNQLGHYINQNQLASITRFHQPKCQIYSKQEQLFYMKICTISVDFFLKNQVILISLTSKRMSHQKRKAHLIARRALLNRFQQLLLIQQ